MRDNRVERRLAAILAADVVGYSQLTGASRALGRPNLVPLALARSILEKAGVEFIPENGGGAGVRLVKRGRRPKQLQTASVDGLAFGSRFSIRCRPRV